MGMAMVHVRSVEGKYQIILARGDYQRAYENMDLRKNIISGCTAGWIML